MEEAMYTVKVGEATPAGSGRPSAGPVYRSIYAKDGLMQLPQEIQSPWDFFSGAVKKFPKNRMLGRRKVSDGKAGDYVWHTYEQVYQKVTKIGAAITSFGVKPGAHCAIYGCNCPEWVMAMQACNSQGICYVPLYDTLGENAVEFILDHAEISIAFMQESKIKSIKEGLGGRIRLMLSGAAPLPRHIEEFMRVTGCSVLAQGYGLTESCAGCFTSIANVFSMIGTVGPPVTAIEARLESVPEMGYDALSNAPRGEICLRGHTMFSGYYKHPDLTEEVFSDGWFRTGDIGEWQPDGTMKIIDRKKNIFKLSQGEYVAVEVVESAYVQSPLVASVWVYGNSFESFLVGVVVPEKQAIEDWAALNGMSGDYAEFCNDPKARRYIQDELNKTGKKLGLRGFEMLKAVHLEPVPFSIDKDLITPTFKLKRPQLLKYYKDHVDQLYKDAKMGTAQ
ncbi:hypothetical protein ACQ4PT_013870 [Festuca glaucescens]